MDKSYLLLVMFLLVQGKGIVTQDDPAQDELVYYSIDPEYPVVNGRCDPLKCHFYCLVTGYRFDVCHQGGCGCFVKTKNRWF